jgi:hypothetical protein
MKTPFLRSLLGTGVLLAAASAAAQGTKWHPGHYIMLGGGGTGDEHMWQMAEVRNDEAIRGFMVRVWWYDLEPAADQYDFSLIDTYLERVSRLNTPKHLVVRIMDRRFRTDDDSGIVPDYLLTDPIYNGGVVRSNTGYVARLWEEPVMLRLTRLYQALGERYDSDPHFEGAFTEETTLSLPAANLPPGYSHQLLGEQYVAFINAVKPTMPTSNLFMNANWIGSSAVMSNLIQEIRDARVGAGGSNVIPGRLTQGQQVLNGGFGADYRLEVPIANGVESGELGGSLGDFTPEEISAHAYTELQAHYLFWTRKTWAPNPEQDWYTGVLPHLRSEPPIRTRCPNVYGICNTEEPPRRPNPNEAPIVSAGADTSLLLPEDTLTLAGSVIDDDLPGPLASVQWTQVSGPLPATFAEASSPTSAVTFPLAGAYVLRLTANDGELEGSDELTVTVTAENQPPLVDAGADVSIELLTESVTLAGTATDDGLPEPLLSLAWTQVSGPLPATFSDSASATSAVTFPATGTYVLRLTASDGELEGGDELTVIVGAGNQPPQVDAGSGMSIQLPTASVTLMASVTDDGLPGTALNLTWSQLSGPATAVFGAADAASTLVTFPAAGSYVLQLTADDGALATSDDVTVTVNAAADPAPEPTPEPETEPPPAPEPETEPPPAPDPSPSPGGSGGNPAPTTPPSAGGTSGGGSFGLIELSLLGLIALGRAAWLRPRAPSGVRSAVQFSRSAAQTSIREARRAGT